MATADLEPIDKSLVKILRAKSKGTVAIFERGVSGPFIGISARRDLQGNIEPAILSCFGKLPKFDLLWLQPRDDIPPLPPGILGVNVKKELEFSQPKNARPSIA